MDACDLSHKSLMEKMHGHMLIRLTAQHPQSLTSVLVHTGARHAYEAVTEQAGNTALYEGEDAVASLHLP